jgi:hypothetical protein
MGYWGAAAVPYTNTSLRCHSKFFADSAPRRADVTIETEPKARKYS